MKVAVTGNPLIIWENELIVIWVWLPLENKCRNKGMFFLWKLVCVFHPNLEGIQINSWIIKWRDTFGVKSETFLRSLFCSHSFLHAVQSDSRYSDVEIRSDEGEICSEISATSSDKHSWCKIVRNSDLCSATMENKR